MAKQNTIAGDVKHKAAIEYMTAPYGSKAAIAEQNGVKPVTVYMWVQSYKKFGDHAFTKTKRYPISYVKELTEKVAQYEKILQAQNLIGE